MTLSTVILAAGQGKRMFSQTPKVLHALAGKPLLEHVIQTSYSINKQPPIVVYGHEGEKVKKALSHLNVTWVPQEQQLGTGHALLQTLSHIPDEDRVLILYGDVPLISSETLKKLLDTTAANAIGMLTAHFPNPHGLGRIIRDDDGTITKIIEEKDAQEHQRRIKEINSGIYVVPAKLLKKWLPSLKNKNAQQEYYLTDIIELAVAENIPVQSTQPQSFHEVLGINDRVQLSIVERYHQQFLAEKLMHSGVTIRDPQRLDIRGNLIAGKDTIIDINVIFEGEVKIGDRCFIGPNTVISNTTLENDVVVRANSVIDGAKIASGCIVGPFARIRPETVLSENSLVGNFVEVKKSTIGSGTKISHLSYIGDSELGKNVNVGAGTITCNYDGVNKHKTIIGDHAFIGSDTQLVAPVSVGEGATIGAGSTITKDVPANQLTLSRTPQRTVENWERPSKKEK